MDRSTKRERVSGPLRDEGLLNILRAGGCHCEPPGVGEEFCTGHCRLRAEIERLHEQRLAEHQQYDLWRIERDVLRAVLAHWQGNYKLAMAGNEELSAEIERLGRRIREVDDGYVKNFNELGVQKTENERLRAEIAQLLIPCTDLEPHDAFCSGGPRCVKAMREEVAEQYGDEIERLRATLTEESAENDQWQKKVAELWAEIERLKENLAALGKAYEARLADYERLGAKLGSLADSSAGQRISEQEQEIERLQVENGALTRMYALAEETVRERTEQLNEVQTEVQAENERLRADQRYLDESVRNQAIRETIHKGEIKRLKDALEKHHWPDLVPGDGPCDVCGLDASVAY